MSSVVLATIPSDSHCLNLIYIEKYMKESGFSVYNLGCCTPIEEVVTVCADVQPVFVVISTLNGHGYMEGITLAAALRENPLTVDLPLFIGGNIGVNIADAPTQAMKLCDAGFTDAFYGDDQWARFCKVLQTRIRVLPHHSKLQYIKDLPTGAESLPWKPLNGFHPSMNRSVRGHCFLSD